jgi:N-acetylglucosamine-6-phosphate deacetylase
MIALRAARLFDGRNEHEDAVILIENGRITGIAADAPPGVPIEELHEDAILAPGYIDLQVNGGGGLMFNGDSTPQDLAAITAITEADIHALSAAFPAPVLLTLAPDAVAPLHIAALARAGIIVFAGHSDASYEQARDGIDAGIRGATHLFNAMSQFAGRAPGLVGAILDDARAAAGIIADGHHAHPAALRIALNALGPERLFLVSDAMATAGSEITGFTLAGEAIFLRDGRLTNAEGTLAGAHLTMAEAVRNLVAFTGCDWTTAVRMATATPAEIMGLEDRGVIAVGARADLVVLDDDLQVMEIWQGGTRL